MYTRRLRLLLTVLLIIIGITSLCTNIYYVYHFGPPYQSADGVNARDVRSFSPIILMHHKSKNLDKSEADKVHQSLDLNVRPEVERKLTSVTKHEKATSKSQVKPSKMQVTSKTTASIIVTTNAVSTTRSTVKKIHNSFLLAASYSNSINSLPKSLLQLGQFAKDLGITDVVAPWVFRYQVYGIKRLVTNADKGMSALAMNRLYDLKSVNTVMSQCSGTKVSAFSDFIENTVQNITIIYFSRSNFNEPSQFNLLKHNELAKEYKKAQVIDCTSLINSRSQTVGKDLVDALNAELSNSSQKFHISSYICVNNSRVVKMQQINDVMKMVTKRNGNNTVVLLNWRGFASLVKKPYDSLKYWVETGHSYPVDKCSNTIMPLHFELPRSAHQFLRHSRISSTDYFSVYISFEYLARSNDTAYASCCLKETNRVIGAMMTRYHFNQILIIGDHSNQSSTTCDNQCVKKSAAMVTMMTSWGLNVTRFNPDVTSAKHHHPAYNLFAEVNLLSTGKRLVLVGQNPSYSQIKTSFIQHYPTDGNSKLYSICITTGTYLRDLTSKAPQCKKKK